MIYIRILLWLALICGVCAHDTLKEILTSAVPGLLFMALFEGIVFFAKWAEGDINKRHGGDWL